MSNTFNIKELPALLAAARAGGRAEGYAEAKLEMALERANASAEAPEIQKPAENFTPPAQKLDVVEKLKQLGSQAEKAEQDTPYTTRTTVAMTKTIALDYAKSVAPRIVGPSEIIKNSKKTLNVFISFGTLKRAMDSLIEAGEIEQTEPSRWKYKGRIETVALKSVR